MYHTCIFCSANLRANDALERFPVGRSIAFDAARGRLWAICTRCARWNLAPIEERWEAVEDAERLFRGTRTRVQRENIGLARLPGGTRLVRVGDALPGELAAWRYGWTLARRRRREQLIAGTGAVAAGATGLLAVGLAGMATLMLGGGFLAFHAVRETAVLVRALTGANRLVHQARVRYCSRDVLVRVLGKHLPHARLQADFEGRGIELHVPALWGGYGAEHFGHDVTDPLVLRGSDAARVMGRALVRLNRSGATLREVRLALADIESAGSPRDLLMQVARRRRLLNGVEVPDWVAPPYDHRATRVRATDTRTTLAVEMALHDETERQAMDGELPGLREMWREAEEIAAIADRLPGIPAPEPPRMEW